MIDVEKQIEEVMVLVGKLEARYGDARAAQALREDDVLDELYAEARVCKLEVLNHLRTLLSSAQSGEQAPYAVLTREIGESDFFDHKPVKPNSVHHLHAKQSPYYDYVELYTHPAPAMEVERDAKRWKMVELICREVMLSPDKRTEDTAVSAYVNAVGSGLDYQAAVDAAIAASQPNG
jgi:hypothetical protein